jgi:hypothetical protein
MEKYEKILVPLDGSECAENILSTVEKLATDLKVSIALLRVAYAHTFPGVDPTEAEVKVVREAEKYLQGIEKRLQAKGFRVESHVRYGDEAGEILDHAAQKDFDSHVYTWSQRSQTLAPWECCGKVAQPCNKAHFSSSMYLIICPLKFLYEKVNESSQNESPLFSPIKNIFPLLGYGDWLNKSIHPSNPFRIIILAKAASKRKRPSRSLWLPLLL